MNIYGLKNRRTCDTAKAELREDNYFNLQEDIGKFGRGGYTATALVQGYVNAGCYVKVPYSGYYGEGYVLCFPTKNPYTGKTSSKYMRIYYYTK